MHIFIVAAVSSDGFIARDSQQNSMSWSSKEDKNRFVDLTKRAGCIVMGRTTFETIGKPLKDRRNIIYSKSGKTFEGTETTSEEPRDLVARLSREGVKELAVCGGSHIYTLFMKAGLIDRIYLTVEPVFFGKGLNLFNESIDATLTLVSSETTPSGTLLLEYTVKK